MYTGVPARRWATSPETLGGTAKPKSSTFTRSTRCPSSSSFATTITLSGFTSRWMRPRPWAWPRPPEISSISDTMRGTSKTRSVRCIARSVAPSTNAIAR